MKILKMNEAIDYLKAHDVIAIPTETVYGLAADATNDKAVTKIFSAKGRPADNPLIVHIGEIDQLNDLVSEVNEQALKLINRYWPGPLTVVLPSNGKVSQLVTAGLSTVGIRMPNHPVALDLLKTSKIVLAAPSANLSGRPSPTSTKHVINDLSGIIPGVLEGGECVVGLESTVIDFSSEVPTILRPGNITRDQIEEVIGPVNVANDSSETPKSPGMKYTHYAPDAEVILVKGTTEFVAMQVNYFKSMGISVGVLCHENHIDLYENADVVKSIGYKGRELYSALRAFDEDGVTLILSECYEDDAMMNRLNKASEGRVLEPL